MPMIHQTSTNSMFSFKSVLIISTISALSAAIVLAMVDFPVCVPSIYNGVVSWLRPPYLYLVVNCIIITIVAFSKLQDDVSPTTQPPSGITVQPQPVKSIQWDYPTTEYKYNGVVLDESSGYRLKEEKVLDQFEGYEREATIRGRTKNEQLLFVVNDAAAADAMSNKENLYVNAKSTTCSGPENIEYSNSSIVKPPFSARFSHRRNVKANPEGGRTVLGVSKPKRQDTLESTWKTITEGRPIPMSRHLKKSDTWERDSHCHQHNRTPQKTMTKAETFNYQHSTDSPSPGSSGGSGKLRREPSLSQDDLNRRVEAFIKKFNEEMRLQRRDSLNQYMEMISH